MNANALETSCTRGGVGGVDSSGLGFERDSPPRAVCARVRGTSLHEHGEEPEAKEELFEVGRTIVGHTAELQEHHLWKASG